MKARADSVIGDGGDDAASAPWSEDAFYRHVVDNAVDGFFVVDTERRFVEVNDTLSDLLGYGRAELLGKTPLDFVTADSREDLQAQFDRMQATDHRRYRLTATRKDGAELPILINATTFRGPAGDIRGAFGFVTDLRPFAAAEQAVAWSERELQRILDHMQDTYYRTDLEGRLERMSRSAERLLGWSREELLGRPLAEIYRDPAERAGFLQALAEAGGSVTGYEACMRHRDGHDVWVLTNAQYVFDGSGHVVGIEGTTRDITDWRRVINALRDSEARLEALIEALPDAVFLKDELARWRVVNPAGKRLFRLLGDEWLGKTSAELALLRPDLEADMTQCQLTDQAAWKNRRMTVSEEVVVDEHGRPHPWEFVKLPLFNPDGSAKSLVVVARDLTEQRLAEEHLRLAAQVFQNSGEAIMITDRDNLIVSVNRAFTEMTGYRADEVLGKKPSILASDRHDPAFYQHMWRTLMESGHWQGEIWNRRKTGELYPGWLGISTLWDDHGELSHYVAIFSDISERKAAEARIEYLAHHDPLTHLPNRVLFKDRLEQAIAHGERSGARVALLFVDLDRFKTVNDSLGHPVGDLLLQEAALRLTQVVREMDTVSRQGGDEFLLVLPELRDTEDVTRVAEALLERLAEPFLLDSHELAISASVGIAVFPEDGHDFDSLLKKADIAMYHAKEAGRNAFRYFTERMNIDALERLDLQNRLRRGLDQGEFLLHYQPLVELPSGRVVGAEALVRWNNPDLGLVMPNRFIGVAEESGLIVPLGEWVLAEACRELRRWHDAGHGHLSMAVNLSAIQFRRGSVEEDVTRALELSGANPARLELELTESILLQGADHVLATVRRLKNLGVRLSIDDFGTGYSSLAYLKRFAVDKLKIDQSFVRDLPTDPDDAAIVRAVIQMARSLNLQVLAEGVEDAAVAHDLSLLNCDYAQGFHFGRPMSAEDFRRRIVGVA